MGVRAVGFVRERVGRNGVVRYQALYKDVKGDQRSAGTFATEDRAIRAWQREEDKLDEGRLTDTRRGKQRFRRYVEEEWFPNHQMEATTRQNYSYYLDRYILSFFGKMTMISILPADVREWVTKLKNDQVRPSVIRYSMMVLSAIFTTALNDQITHLHPCRGVKTPPVPKKPRAIVTPEQFDKLYAALPAGEMQMLVELDIESGLRWGELTELRPYDVEFATGTLTVSRVAVELVPRFHPTGGRFLVREYPKDKEYRRFKVSEDVTKRLETYVGDFNIGDDDLLFPMPQASHPTAVVPAPDPSTLGLTPPNASGRSYQHGTITGYSSGKCRCEHCKGAYARYRAARRAAGKDDPRQPRRVDTDGHLPRRWFRDNVWLPALQNARLHGRIHPHGLRHAHASWLLAGGADLQIVKERLGHASIATTEKYLHTLPEADETALKAFSRIRNRTAS